ncbi:MAG: hypothetical protein WDN69_00145 [Aliidongia sp.]
MMPLGPETALVLLFASAHGFKIDHAQITAALENFVLQPGQPVAALLPLLRLALLAKAADAAALCEDMTSLLLDPSVSGQVEPAALAQLAEALTLCRDAASLRTAHAIAIGLAEWLELWTLRRTPAAVTPDDMRTLYLVLCVLCRHLPELPLLSSIAFGLRTALETVGNGACPANEVAIGAWTLGIAALLHKFDPEGGPVIARALARLLALRDREGTWSEDPATTATCLETFIALRPLSGRNFAVKRVLPGRVSRGRVNCPGAQDRHGIPPRVTDVCPDFDRPVAQQARANAMESIPVAFPWTIAPQPYSGTRAAF